ncbi:MAG: hypothetical protein KHZ58_15920 [Hungatella hathewayi]|nr:hypothetical protein [Hungatella hathewayi]
MPGKVAWTKYKKKRPNETKEEREARIAREMRKAKHAKEVSAVVPSRVSYVKKPFAENSLFSIGLAIVALAFLALGVAGSVRTQGQGALNVGAFGLCSLLVSLVAVWYGIRSFREKDKNYILARIGTGVGVVLILAWLVMILLGMRG